MRGKVEGGANRPRTEVSMHKMPWRLRLLGTLLRPMSVSRMSLEKIEKMQGASHRITRSSICSWGECRRASESRIAGQAPAPPPCQIRIYTPEGPAAEPRSLVVYCHGGGWVLGSVGGGDWMCSTVARDLDAVVVSIDYRLAPQHKFPAAIEDCYAGLLWSQANAATFARIRRIGVMGESAGGNLAAVICLLARERGGPSLKHQALLYPGTDVSMSTESFAVNKDAIILTAEDARSFVQHYLGPDADPRDWRISPSMLPITPDSRRQSSLPPATTLCMTKPCHTLTGLENPELRSSSSNTRRCHTASSTSPTSAGDAKTAMTQVIEAQRDHLRA